MISISIGAVFIPLANPVQEFIVGSSHPIPTHVWNLELDIQVTVSAWSITAIPSLRVPSTQIFLFFKQSISVILDDASSFRRVNVSA